jgi:hypothetical protein
MLLEFPFVRGDFHLIYGKFGYADGKFGFFGRNIEIVVPKPPKDTFAANAKEPYLAASKTFPRVVAEQRQDMSLDETDTGQAAHVRVTADPANAGRLLRNRS